VSATEAVLVLALASVVSARAASPAPIGPDTVTVRSGSLQLGAVLWRPSGYGPFPAVLFDHGSGHGTGVGSDGTHDHRQPNLLGPVFARHGYVFLYLFRRGDGLSRGQGTADGDRMDQELAAHGQAGRNQIQLRLLEGDELEDALSGLAYLRTLPEVDTTRVAAVGHSFGGSLTVLVAERDSSLRAAVSFAPGGYSWDRSPAFRARLLAAVDRTRVPIFFIHAANDLSIRPGQAMAAEMARLGKPHRVEIYPAVGRTKEEGHDFIHLRVASWESDLFGFLDRYMRR
jgi:dienelactone hydrolase